MTNSVNGSLLYSCDDGFEATSGNLSRECTLNGTWSGEPPVCAVITCPALTLPENAGIAVHPPSSFSTNGNGTQQTHFTGSEAIYTCNPGFNHSGGDLTRTCLSNGTWSGDPAMCNEIFCEPLTAVSIFALSTNVSNSMGISVNTTATFSCSPGFQINSSSSLLCQIDGTWNGTQANCLEEVCQDRNTPQNTTLLSINRYLHGTAHFACNDGFQHTNGSLQRECLSSGEWSGVAPVCTFIRECKCPCGMVHVPKYTDINDEKLAQEIEQMKKELKVLKNQTSAALRKKISVKDFRPSANASGAVWVVVLMVIAGCIIVPDLIRALRHLLSCCRPRSKT